MQLYEGSHDLIDCCRRKYHKNEPNNPPNNSPVNFYLKLGSGKLDAESESEAWHKRERLAALIARGHAKQYPESLMTNTMILGEGILSTTGISSGDKVVVDVDSIVTVTPTSFPTTAITICVWMKTIGLNDGTIVSYAVPSEDNEFTLYRPYDVMFEVKGSGGHFTDFVASDGIWHHVCGTWQSNDGALVIYINGYSRRVVTNVKTDETITGGGSLILGQEQDSVGGDFDSDEAFIGEIALFNMWDYVLSPGDILASAKDCHGLIEGNLFSWKSHADSQITVTDATVQLADVCSDQPVNARCAKVQMDHNSSVVVSDYSPIPPMSEVTACIWVKTSATNQGTPFSYSANNDDLELAIVNTMNMRLYVDYSDVSPTGYAVNDGAWHHVCTTWESTGGEWVIYDNGVSVGSGTNFKTGAIIEEAGEMMLGQKNNDPYEECCALVGELALFNMWDFAMNEVMIQSLSVDTAEGNIFAWRTGLLYISRSAIILPNELLQECMPNILCKRYEVFTSQVEWSLAKFNCESTGGRLAMMNTKPIYQMTREFILDGQIDQAVHRGFWFGLARDSNGEFIWSDGTPLGDFTRWAKGQPNNNQQKDSNGQQCAQLW
uniref:Uncharacterized protein LOC100373811 n=1 Tax=Saccoglossus kowalevskii TaxID=10224 RepID=A0ABM0M9Y6_SACKO|nr:PREDICTED: uncharacterized protein LOC100373811 [Saccoglossus kowalevskii]